MYGKFVGLDIGSEAIKISLLKRGLRETQLLQTILIKTPDSPQAVSQALSRAFSENSLPKGDLAAPLSNNPISIRVLNFPFSDPKKIDNVYEFELENVSTFDPAQKSHGYHLIRRGNEGEALVCMFDKEDIRSLIGMCEEGGIDPRVVTFSPIAFSSLDGFLSGERPLLFVDMGASSIGFSLFDKDGLRRVRSSSKAGRSVTDAVSRLLGVPAETAEKIKREGFKGESSSVLIEALAPVLDEVKKTTQFFELELKERVKTVFISGGMSLMPGILNYLGKELDKDVKLLFIPDLGRDASPVFAKSYALALYGSAVGRGNFNLRKGEFKYTGKNEELRKAFMIPALLLALLLVLSLYRSGARYFDIKERVEEAEARIEKSVKETFPNLGLIPKPAAFMESEVKKVREKLALIERAAGGATPLDVLRDISESVPSSMGLRVDELSFVDDTTVRLVGKSDSSEEVARAEKSLSESGLFQKVVRDSTETAANNTVKFQISLVLHNGYKLDD